MIPLDDIRIDIHLFQLTEQGVRLDKVERQAKIYKQ